MAKSLVAAKVEVGSLPDKPALKATPNQRKKVKTVFSLNDVKQVRPLADLEQSRFKIRHANPTNFYIYLMPSDSMFFDAEFKLKYAIMEWLKKCPDKVPSPPGIATIVLAPEGEGQKLRYLRALIVDLNTKGTFAFVQYFDIGLHAWVEVASMKPISAAIMEFPRLVYTTVLAGFSIPGNNILWSEYEAEMQKHIDKDFFIKIDSDSPDPKDLFSPARVSLWYKKLTETIDLVSCMAQLHPWEWVRVSGLTGSDKDLWAKGKYGVVPGDNDKLAFLEKVLLRPHLTKHLIFKASFSKIYPFRSGDAKEGNVFGATPAKSGILEKKRKDRMMTHVAIVMLVAINEQRYCNYLNLMQTEIKKYTAHIQPTDRIPTYDYLLIRIKKEKIWYRAIKIEHNLYLIDMDEYINLHRGDFKQLYELRRPYREFFKIPRMTLAVHVQSRKRDGLMRMDEAIKTFTKVSVDGYTFRITKPETASEYAEVSLE